MATRKTDLRKGACAVHWTGAHWYEVGVECPNHGFVMVAASRGRQSDARRELADVAAQYTSCPVCWKGDCE